MLNPKSWAMALWRRPQLKASPTIEIPVLSPLDLNSPQFVENPYPFLAWLRTHQPLHKSLNGAWVLTRYNDIVAALRDQKLCNAPAPHAVIHQRNASRYLCAEVANNTIPFMDGDKQVQLRKLIAKSWSTQLKRRPPPIADFATTLLKPLIDFGQFDLLEEFSTPLASKTISDILGIPASLQNTMQKDAAYFFFLFTSFPNSQERQATDNALMRLRAAFKKLIAQRKKTPQEDLISLLCTACNCEKTTEVIADHLILLLADGIENVDSGITSSISSLLQQPTEWRKLCNAPDLAEQAAIECLRFESPGQYIGRVVSQDHERNGQFLKQGDVILLMLASANRDSEAFTHPDTLDISRTTNPSLAFGRGTHSCIGASLTVQELTIALRVISEKAPSLSLQNKSIKWLPRVGHRWPQPITVCTT